LKNGSPGANQGSFALSLRGKDHSPQRNRFQCLDIDKYYQYQEKDPSQAALRKRAGSENCSVLPSMFA
jgi:hypothetical protein